jgi:hypothetical protein
VIPTESSTSATSRRRRKPRKLDDGRSLRRTLDGVAPIALGAVVKGPIVARHDPAAYGARAEPTRQKLLDMVLAHVKEEQYPSVTMMNRIEVGLRTPEQVEEYAEG